MDAVEPLARMLAEDGLKPVAVVLTHGHLDHTFSVLPVCDGYDIPAYLHPADNGMLADPARWHGPALAPLITGVQLPDPSDVRPLDDGAVLDLAGVRLSVRHAPGHTKGSVMFSLDLGEAPGLLAGGGGVHRRRDQGDVHLRRPRRPLADAAPGADRGPHARLHRAPDAHRRAPGEAVDGRLGLPLRAPAGRPLPPLHPGRHGGA